MAPQFDFGTIDPTTKSGSQLASDLNNQRNAINSLHLGASEPTYKTSGMLWTDTSANPVWKLKMYDGSAWITITQIDTTVDAASAYINGIIATLGTASSLNAGSGPSQVPTNSLLGALAYLSTVGTSNIANGAVTSALIAASAVGTTNLANSSVTGQKVAANTLDVSKFAAQAANKLYTTNSSGMTTLVDYTTARGMVVYSSVGTSTFTPPEGVTSVKVTVVGGGGGGGASANGSGAGSSGGTSSFGSYCSATGGSGGIGAYTSGTSTTGAGGAGGAGGVGVGGTINLFGGSGQAGQSKDGSYSCTGGSGGCSFMGGGGSGGASATSSASTYAGKAYGSGGGGGFGGTGSTYMSPGCGGGGAGGTAILNIESGLSSDTPISVTVGAGGSGGSITGYRGGNGCAGVVIVEY